MLQKYYFLWLLLLAFFKSFAQIPVGTWQSHAGYRSTRALSIVHDKVYVASENGFFYFDISEKSFNILSKSDGLSETGISQIAYDAPRNQLILAYKSGNIDLLTLNEAHQPNTTINLPLIRESTAIVGSRNINHIELSGNIAYLSTDFGLVLLDLSRREIKETYQNIGKNGSSLAIYATTLSTDSIFVATQNGILAAANHPTINLQYFGNWQNIFPEKVQKITYFNQNLYASIAGKGISKKTATGFQTIYPSTDLVVHLQIIQNKLLACTSKKIIIFDINQAPTVFANTLFHDLQQAQTDALGNLWATDHQQGLFSNFQGNFKLFLPQMSDTLIRPRPDSVITDHQNNRWTRISGGILVQKSSPQQSAFLGANNGLPSTEINSISLDRNQQLWVATSKGVAIFNTELAFTNNNIVAYFAIFDNRRLLANENIRAIATDGGNRKWIGTPNGVFLFSAEGNQQLAYFHAKNSPLPNNDINAIKINATTGEVFFETSQGMVSYRGTATEPDSSLNNVHIFPNPFHTNSDNMVSISGLKEKSSVKITTSSGRLIYQTYSAGGTAVWQPQNAETGVYFVFIADAEANETLVGKIAIINQP